MDPALRNVLIGGVITALLTLLVMIENRRRSLRRAELDRRELARAHAEDEAAMRADLDAYAALAPECVYLENVGAGVARNVKMTILDGKHPLVNNSPPPMPELRPRVPFAFRGAFTMGQLPCRADVRWTDPDGRLRQKVVSVDLRS